ncbi:MAG: FAD-binding protein [Eggerthellaceae bacterium]
MRTWSSTQGTPRSLAVRIKRTEAFSRHGTLPDAVAQAPESMMPLSMPTVPPYPFNPRITRENGQIHLCHVRFARRFCLHCELLDKRARKRTRDRRNLWVCRTRRSIAAASSREPCSPELAPRPSGWRAARREAKDRAAPAREKRAEARVILPPTPSTTARGSSKSRPSRWLTARSRTPTKRTSSWWAPVSGLACAASATEEGADVILFAASSQPVARGGSNHGIGTKFHERLGITDYTKDTIDGYIRQELARNGYRVDQKKWYKWINNSASTMNWLIDLMEGKGYTTTMEIGYTDTEGVFTAHPGSHNWVEATDGTESGAATGQNLVIAMYEEKIKAQGGQIHYNTIGQYLVRDDDGAGRVSAIVAKDPDGNYVKYVGKKGIVLATGDFSANQDMMAKYCSWVAPLLQYNEVDYDAMFQFGGLGPGDGQKMGLWAGAAWQQTLPNAPMIDAVGPMPYRQSIADFSGLLLNKKGERYSNEDVIFSYGTYAMMMQPDMTRYGIWTPPMQTGSTSGRPSAPRSWRTKGATPTRRGTCRCGTATSRRARSSRATPSLRSCTA